MVYTFVRVMILSLMSFNAPEGRFLKGLPENGQPYQNWSDLTLGFVQYQHCIFYIPCIPLELLLKVTNTMLMLDKSKSQITLLLVRLAIFM